MKNTLILIMSYVGITLTLAFFALIQDGVTTDTATLCYHLFASMTAVGIVYSVVLFGATLITAYPFSPIFLLTLIGFICLKRQLLL